MQKFIDLLRTYNSSIATLLAGAIVWYLYGKAKRDEIRTAAKTIILEIKEAEKVIRIFLGIKNSEGSYPTDFYKITPYKAWEKYSHLFIKKLNNDEYQQVNEFYKKCEILEKYIEKNYNFFWITTEERARQKERIGVENAYKLIATNENVVDNIKEGEYREQVEKISLLYMSNTPAYLPVGIKTEIDKILNSISLIINTPTWNNLKRIADYKDILG
jgi:cbb3-type cytochrome oxidase subunit 3